MNVMIYHLVNVMVYHFVTKQFIATPIVIVGDSNESQLITH